jgi:hypothetical protein
MKMQVEAIAKVLYFSLVAGLAVWCWTTMEGDWVTRAVALVLFSPVIVFASIFVTPVVAIVAALIKGAAIVIRFLARAWHPRSPV